MGKFGKPVEVKLDLLSYNIGLIGESGIGKSTMIKDVCEKLAGKDGYISLDLGKEMGHDAIQGIVSERIEDWEKLEEVMEDIIDNKSEEYPNLKVVVFDTIDQLFDMAEKETIRLYNKTVPIDKKAHTINSAWGGFGKGLDKAIDLVLDVLWELKKVGVAFIAIGHVKQREQTDIETELSYRTLTTDITQRYFNALKNKLHILGVASIDREIVKEKTGKINIATNKEKTKGVIKSEARKITFRDDNYSIDSKSRFSNIVDSIPLDADAFIDALQNALKLEYSKSGKDIDKIREKQIEEAKIKQKELDDVNNQNKQKKLIQSKIDEIMQFVKANKNNKNVISQIIIMTKQLGYNLPTDIDNLENANEILKMIEEIEG